MTATGEEAGQAARAHVPVGLLRNLLVGLGEI